MSDFCKVASDEILLGYENIEDMLFGMYYPGNYTPTQDQARQLIRAAAASAARWVELKKFLPLKEALEGILEKTGEPHTAKFITRILKE